jgi:DNA-directed RNA polymerase subunit beta'
MIKQMLKKVIVIEGNDTGLSAGQTLSLTRMNEINDRVMDEGKVPAKFGPILLGISKSAVETDSFLSAASFQETTRVLTDAAVRGKTDHLEGVKENVIIGKLIPAGTGRDFDRETSRRIRERAAELREEREERARLLEEANATKLPDEVVSNGESRADLPVDDLAAEETIEAAE